jgi:ribosome recycling factor
LIVATPPNWSDLKKDIVRRMDSAVDVLRKEFGGLRSGRASANLLDPVVVEAYGQTMPLSQCGTVGVPEPRMLTVQVWDKGLVKAVEKSIRDAGLGLNPQADGQLIRVPIPSLNEERRKELQKIASKYGEQARISVRNVRRDGMDTLKKMEKDGHISEDEIKKHEKEVQVITDDIIKKIDDALSAKEKEIMQV